MGVDLAQLLSVPVYRALDTDDAGRVLVGTDESGSMQLLEVDPQGHVTPLTALPGPCAGQYVPGQRAVIVVHDDGGNERGQLSVLSIEGAVAPAGLADLTPLVHDPQYVHSVAEVDRERLCYVTNRRNGVDFDVIVRDLASGAETVGYDGGGNVGDAVLSIDGRWLAVTVPAVPALSDQILVIDLAAPDVGGDASSRTRALTGPAEHARNERLHWTPAGEALLVTSNRDRDFTGIARVDIATGEWRWLVTDDTADVTGWLSPDGAGLLVETNVDGTSRVALHDATDGGHLRDVALPARGCVQGMPLPGPTWSVDSRTIVASFSGATVPGDVLRIDVATGRVDRLTDSAAPLATVDLAEPRSCRIPTLDGEEVPCFVYPAAPGASALRGSSVISIHGGPEGQSKDIFNPVVTGLRLAGFTVLVPNVRGSVGYGKRWYSLDDVRLRLDSVADLAAIHEFLPALDLDPTRAALWGGSYGGYMVLAGLAFQSARWAAGVDIVGISSLVTFLRNTSAYRRAIREREYGSLTDDLDFLHEASPLTRIDDIRAPLFVIHGANDPRVPLSEAEQLHAALRAGGIECELVVYPDEGHGLAKRVNRLDAYPRAFSFLTRHLAAKS